MNPRRTGMWSLPGILPSTALGHPAQRQCRERTTPWMEEVEPRLEQRPRMRWSGRARLLVLLGLLMLPSVALATVTGVSTLPDVTIAKIGEDTVSVPLQILLTMTALTLIPAALLGMTAFTRIIIVLGLLRQALGTGQAPSNQVLLSLALFLTALIMMPVIDRAWMDGIAPYLDGKMEFLVALKAAAAPLRGFMLAQIRENDLLTFASMAGHSGYATPADVPFSVLAPAFLTSEIKTAFEIGFLLFVPFVVIDLVVSSVLMSMGMMMLSPMLISAPFKILLFVLVDGWVLVVGSLAASFQTP